MYLVPARFQPVLEAALARAVADLRNSPDFGQDEVPGWIVVGFMPVKEPVILTVR